MKKLIAILVVFAVVTGAAFAEGISVGGWGTLSFAPLQIQTPELKNGEKLKDDGGYGDTLGVRTTVGVGPDWIWGNEIGGGISVSGSTDSIGFSISIEPVGNDIFGGVWAKPFNGSDAFKISVGKFNDQTLEGKLGPGGKSGAFVNPAFSGDPWNIFTRLGTSGGEVQTKYGDSGQGFMFSSVPVEGLFLAWNIATDGATRIGNKGSEMRANDAFRGSQVAVGYNIADIGLVRAAYLGGWAGKLDLSDPDSKASKKYNRAAYKPDGDGKAGEKEQASINIAFNLTALENVSFDIGYRGYIPITVSKDYDDDADKIRAEKFKKSSNGHVIAAGVDMTFGIFNLRLFGKGQFGSYSRNVNSAYFDDKPYSKDKSRNGLTLNFKIDPSISLDFGTIGLSLAYQGKYSPTKALENDAGEFTKFGRDKDAPDYEHNIGMGLWYERGLGNGSFVIALTYTFPTLEPGKDDAGKYDKAKFNGSHYIQLPITLTYWF